MFGTFYYSPFGFLANSLRVWADFMEASEVTTQDHASLVAKESANVYFKAFEAWRIAYMRFAGVWEGEVLQFVRQATSPQVWNRPELTGPKVHPLFPEQVA